MSNWCGVRWTSSPAFVTSRFSRSTTRSPISIDRLARGGHAAQACAQPGQELVDPDRLRHVIVGPGVERRNLLVLVADRGEDDHRRAAPRSELAAHVGARAVGQDQVEDHRVGRAHRRLRERGLRRLGGLDLVPRRPQAGAQRAQDLRLVVDDEDARPRAHADRLDCCGDRSARGRTSPPGPSGTRPRHDRRWPRRTRARCEPEPGAAAPARRTSPAGTARRCSRAPTRGCRGRGRSPGPCSSPDVSVTWTPTRSSSGEYLSAFSIRLTSARSIWWKSARTAGDSSGSEDVDPRSRRRRARRARRDESSTVQTSASGWAAPACRRERSRRLATRRSRRRPRPK